MDSALVRVLREAPPLRSDASLPAALPSADWNALVARAQMHGLAPLLYAAIRTRGGQDALPPAALNNLRLAYLRNDIAVWQAEQELGRLLDGFARERIPVILLKGCALAPTLYPAANLRVLGDLDLLIPRAEAERAGAWMRAQGYAPLLDLERGFRERFACEQCYVRGGKQPAQVDLHWHLFNHTHQRARIPIEWFWERTTPVQVGGRTAQIFSPEAQLLHLATHFVLHHRGDGLKWSYDLALLLTRERIEWGAVVEAVRAFGLSQVVRATLLGVSDVWGIPAPAECLDALRPSFGERVQFAFETAPRIEARVVWDAAGISSRRGGAAYLWRAVLPSPGYMRARYKIAHAWQLPFYYLWRVGRGARQFIVSVGSMLANALRLLTRSPHA